MRCCWYRQDVRGMGTASESSSDRRADTIQWILAVVFAGILPLCRCYNNIPHDVESQKIAGSQSYRASVLISSSPRITVGRLLFHNPVDLHSHGFVITASKNLPKESFSAHFALLQFGYGKLLRTVNYPKEKLKRKIFFLNKSTNVVVIRRRSASRASLRRSGRRFTLGMAWRTPKHWGADQMQIFTCAICRQA